ncbi:GNAT family N-acetyltransferase [Rhodobacter sp. KR11]|uniref:GNAT family N-acetyltransferase n=1 Tax=Rhodobacter sp. KR11 TaxID=2974588 RepID=UPI002221C297|nr:GNAT family protein [Rhodobacter sp. KR11]MCW1919983.1 GNAT family N-acetyltransferase [Rhodobacter sp. KR11]
MTPRIETPRLILRPLGPQDQVCVLQGLNDLAVSSWLSVVPYPYVAADFQAFQTGMAHPGQTWAMTEAGRFAGVLGMENATLGYWLLPWAQGRGLATEAAGAALGVHFAGGGGEVGSGYFAGNARSAGVLAKLGFAEVARDVKFCRPMGQDRPHVTLRLTAQAFGLSAYNLV